MDKIIMKNMAFFGYHGVLPEENTLGQKFIISVELLLSLRRAGESDEVADTVNYGEAFEIIKEIVENRTFKLLEALGENIAAVLLVSYKEVDEVIVEIKKPEAPVKGIFDYFGVEIRRSRNE